MGQPRAEGGVRQVENVLCRVLKTRMLFLTLSEMVPTIAEVPAQARGNKYIGLFFSHFFYVF